MDTIHAPVLAVCALAFSLCTAHATTKTGDGPLASVARHLQTADLWGGKPFQRGATSDLHNLCHPGRYYLVLQANSTGGGLDGDGQR